METKSAKKLVFHYGTDYNYLKFTRNNAFESDEWAAYLISFDGGQTGHASTQMQSYYNAFNFFRNDLTSGVVTEDTFNWTPSHKNYGYSGHVVGEFYVGSLGDEKNEWKGRISLVGVTSRVITSEAEIHKFMLNPVSWITSMNGLSWKKPDGATATFSSAGGDEAAEMAQMWLMGDDGGGGENILNLVDTNLSGFDLDMHKMTRSDNFDFHEDDDDDD